MSLTELTAGRYAGRGDGMESGPFAATIDVTALPGGSVAVDYAAVTDAAAELHREHTVVSAGFDGRDRLFVAHAEPPYVTVMIETEPGSGRFEMPEPFGPYDMVIVAGRPSDAGLSWAWHWAPTGGEPVEQSCARVELER